MIKLEVEQYCHNCIDFVPVAYPSSLVANGEYVCTDHVIRCQHHDKCLSKYKYIKAEMEKKDEETT